MEVKVSIIIAAYNIEKYIKKCLESVVNQTFTNLEIIVVNDGSTDSTLEKIKGFKNIDNRIILVNQDNKGLIEARKSGFKVASGDYVLFIDGDDWLDLKAIETLYEIANKDSYDIIQYGYLMVYEDNSLKEGWSFNENKEIVDNEFLEMLLQWKLNNSIWSKFIKREYIIKNNVIFPENISYGEDLAFVISLSIYKPKVYITNKFLYYYYQRSTSLTNNISPKVLEIYDATLFIKKVLINNELFNRYIEEYEYMAYIHNYHNIKDYIYLYKNDLSKEIFKNWRKMKININNNKYYKKLYENESFKSRVIAKICNKNYILGNICYKIINIYSSLKV